MRAGRAEAANRSAADQIVTGSSSTRRGNLAFCARACTPPALLPFAPKSTSARLAPLEAVTLVYRSISAHNSHGLRSFCPRCRSPRARAEALACDSGELHRRDQGAHVAVRQGPLHQLPAHRGQPPGRPSTVSLSSWRPLAVPCSRQATEWRNVAQPRRARVSAVTPPSAFLASALGVMHGTHA